MSGTCLGFAEMYLSHKVWKSSMKWYTGQLQKLQYYSDICKKVERANFSALQLFIHIYIFEI